MALFAGREQAHASVFCDADIAALASVDAAPATNPRMKPRLAFVLESNAPGSLSGDVVVLTQNAAYDVNFSNVAAAKSASSSLGVTKPILVAFPKPLAVEFAWVDEIGMDGAAQHSCPTDPFGGPGGNDAGEAVSLPPVYSMSGFQIVPATFKMNLPVPDCKEAYSAARMVDWGSQETEYFDTSAGLHTAATVRVFLGSDGKVLDAHVLHSSGSAIVDDAAIEKSANATYSPAIFRCAPIVGTVTIEVTYEIKH
ncbi:MAG TPA: energy transducer TonB [Candidatus Rubrimentiphilum sp.]|nr:energy transducer TonB [Candidatus Rubrimentiphilum sp.]